MRKPKKAFAAFLQIKGEWFMDSHSVKPLANQVRQYLSDTDMTWKQVYKLGWRVKPVEINIVTLKSKI